MWSITERGYVRKTRVYIQVLAMGKKTQRRFHHRHHYVVYPCLYYRYSVYLIQSKKKNKSYVFQDKKSAWQK
jgi:hypothetical protein